MQIKDLVLNDGTTDKTFSVVSTQSGTAIPASWKAGTSAINALRIDAITRRVKGQRRSKAELRFVRPIVQVLDGVETLVDTATIVVGFTLPDVLTAADRAKFLNLTESLLNTDVIADLVNNDSPAY